MTCGAPVIASDRGALPEVVGDAGLLIDAEDEVALARMIEMILTTPLEAQRLRDLGIARAAKFSWQKAAKAMLQVYQQLLEIKAATLLKRQTVELG